MSYRDHARKSFPSLTLAPELIPEHTDAFGAKRKWKMVEDVPSSEFKVEELNYRSFLKNDEFWIGGEEMRQRAVDMKGNLGLADAKRLLAEQEKIPQNLRDFYIVFPGTILRDPDDYLDVAYLCWRDDRWSLDWRWLGRGWVGSDRFACSEPR